MNRVDTPQDRPGGPSAFGRAPIRYSAGRTQIAILRTVAGGNWFITNTPQQQTSALHLLDRGLLTRDPKNSRRFSITPAGRDWIIAHDDELARRIG